MTIEDREQCFAHLQHVLETAYLAGTQPWAQSGMSGPQERWNALRKPVAELARLRGTSLREPMAQLGIAPD